MSASLPGSAYSRASSPTLTLAMSGLLSVVYLRTKPRTNNGPFLLLDLVASAQCLPGTREDHAGRLPRDVPLWEVSAVVEPV
jgi:hypothetical protein